MDISKFVVLADNDGTIRDTNGVKDAMLNEFCQELFGKNDSSSVLPTEIHRRMHGRPMAEIFVAIAAEVYQKTISLSNGQEITEKLNEYIRSEYISRPVFPGAREFYTELRNMGLPMFILTGMETDLVSEGLEKNGMKGIFEDILGAPATKEENIKNVLEKYPGYRILAMGDALSEYKATMAIKGTIFLAFDFENRPKKVFPDHVNVLHSYGEEAWQEIARQLKENPLV